jgi:hypothetical protein
MSAIKKGIKKAFKWVRKNWKYIVIAAAIVFTAGIATVGVAGFSSAAAAAGGGVGGFLSAAGSTMVAGVASIGGTLGIGQGANLAAFGGSGYATLGTGAAAQSLGFAGANGAMTAGKIAAGAPSAALGGGPSAALAGGAGTTANVAGGVTSVAAPAAANAAGGTAASGFLANPNTGPLLQAGMGMLSSYNQARAEEEQWNRTKPRGYWGVGLNGEESAEIEQTDNQGMVYDPRSFDGPNNQNTPNQIVQPGLMGNRALDADRRINPNVRNPLSPDWDPALARVNRGASYG